MPPSMPSPVARPERRARRVHARCDRSEPTPPREVRRPAAIHTPWRALRKRRIHQYQCVEVAASRGARQARYRELGIGRLIGLQGLHGFLLGVLGLGAHAGSHRRAEDPAAELHGR
jgi:hypothetical protein